PITNVPGSIPRIIWLSFKKNELNVNKNTKIWLNYIAGGAISLFLLWSIYGQVTKQMAGIGADTWKRAGPGAYLWLCIFLMFVNTSLEGCKWYLLANVAEPLGYAKAFSSYLAGVAFSIITPNRIGEYPGRILYIGSNNTWRYINVSVTGIISQLSGVYIFGLMGLIYYNIAFPAPMAKVALGLCFIANIFIIIIYRRYETWLPALARIKWLQKFSIYGRLQNRVPRSRRFTVLGISILRVAIFTAQYLFLLKWMNVDIPLAEGFFMAALFFWILAVIPGIALIELGVRGSLSIHLFKLISSTPPNIVGMVAATAGIWLLNLIIPSIFGSILIIRMRLLR
ncbi:MAG: lysylphosphatidylglycerol synthase domain-containing protein, partial [Chitinophagales bacterium]